MGECFQHVSDLVALESWRSECIKLSGCRRNGRETARRTRLAVQREPTRLSAPDASRKEGEHARSVFFDLLQRDSQETSPKPSTPPSASLPLLLRYVATALGPQELLGRYVTASSPPAATIRETQTSPSPIRIPTRGGTPRNITTPPHRILALDRACHTRTSPSSSLESFLTFVCHRRHFTLP